jgi:acyl-CoA thioester hydrolase
MLACGARIMGRGLGNAQNMIEIGLGSVQSWECDVMGHLNVQHYVARAVDSIPALLLAAGIGPRAARARGIDVAVADQHIRFLKELRPGAPFTLWGGFLELGGDRLRLYQEIRHTLSGEVVATLASTLVATATADGAPATLPDAFLERAGQMIVPLPDHAAPKGLVLTPPRPRPSWGEADRLGLILTQQSAVAPQDCDRSGRMTTRAVIGRVSDAVPNIIVKTRGVDRSQSGFGGAALEYRLVYHERPREGDLLALRSGIRSLGVKTLIWGHWLFDRETGTAVATSEAVAVSFDLAERKAVAIDDATRAALARHLVPELSV